MLVCVHFSASSRGGDRGSQQGLIVFVSTMEGMGWASIATVWVLVPAVITSNSQAGPGAWEPGIEVAVSLGLVWRDWHDKVAAAGPRRSKPAPSDTPGCGADSHQFVDVSLCVGKTGLKGSKGELLGP